MGLLQRLTQWVKLRFRKGSVPSDTGAWSQRNWYAFDGELIRIVQRNLTTGAVVYAYAHPAVRDRYTFFKTPSSTTREDLKGFAYVEEIVSHSADHNRYRWVLVVGLCSVDLKTPPVSYHRLNLNCSPFDLLRSDRTFLRRKILGLLDAEKRKYHIVSSVVSWYPYRSRNPIW